MKPKVWRFVVLFVLGGAGYNLLECLWRGHTHWSMFFLGGSCFHLIGKIGEQLHRRSAWMVGTVCSAAVTFAEFLSGCLLNLHWKLNVWDYSCMPANLYGQICLLYSVLWGLLSLPVVLLYRCLNRALFRRTSP